jgi:hypothetical protein
MADHRKMQIGPAYEEGLSRYLDTGVYEGKVDPASPGVLLEAEEEGIVLSCLIDPANHRVIEVKHRGSSDDTPRALMNALCSVMVGYGIQDCSEHAAIRLETALRDHARARPVGGVVQPDNADPAFRLPLRLVRAIYRSYQERTGYRPIWNCEDGVPSEAWRRGTPPERVERILSVLPEVCPVTGIRRASVSVIDIRNTKVTLRIDQEVAAEVRQRYLTKCELDLKAKVEGKLELYLEGERDQNVKRHHVPLGEV